MRNIHLSDCTPLLTLSILLVASTAGAEMINLSGSRNLNAIPHVAQLDMGIQLLRREMDGAPIEIVTSATVEVEPVGDVSETWIITEANAGDFGLDWAAAQTWVDEFATKEVGEFLLRIRWFHGAQTAAFVGFGPQLGEHDRIVGGVLDHIELTQRYWIDQQPSGIAGMDWSVFVEGTIVPEPSIMALGLPILVAILHRPHRHKQTRHRDRTFAGPRM
ncbi:MAG: hypothetical protein AB7I57_25260 [Pirellulales bacterium]